MGSLPSWISMNVMILDVPSATVLNSVPRGLGLRGRKLRNGSPPVFVACAGHPCRHCLIPHQDDSSAHNLGTVLVEGVDKAPELPPRVRRLIGRPTTISVIREVLEIGFNFKRAIRREQPEFARLGSRMGNEFKSRPWLRSKKRALVRAFGLLWHSRRLK